MSFRGDPTGGQLRKDKHRLEMQVPLMSREGTGEAQLNSALYPFCPKGAPLLSGIPQDSLREKRGVFQ